MNELIGKKFKRKKYGLSTWTKEISSVFLTYEGSISDNLWAVNVMIKDTEGFVYGLEEIVIKQ